GAGFVLAGNTLGVGVVQVDMRFHELRRDQTSGRIVVPGARGMFPGLGYGCDPGDPLTLELDIHQCCPATEACVENMHDVPVSSVGPGISVVGGRRTTHPRSIK